MRWGELTDAERDEIELEENLQRKDLTAHERSKTLVRLAETAKEVLREQADLRTESVQKSNGRPAQPDSSRAVAERTGIPAQTIREAQQHVEIAETIPALAGPDVKQYRLVEAAKVDREICTIVQNEPLPESHARELAPLLEDPDALREDSRKPLPPSERG